jgi:hypothetical protein
MYLVGRRDWVLIAALGVALTIIFARPIRSVLDVARDVERSSGLALLPALLVLIVVLAFHEQSKRQEGGGRPRAGRAAPR